MAPTGATVNHSGSREKVAWATSVATGVRPRLRASLWRISTSAAAPSEIDDEVAAVTVPSFTKAGRRLGIFDGSTLKGLSSRSTTTSPLRPGMVTGTVSQAKLPSSLAVRARREDSRA